MPTKSISPTECRHLIESGGRMNILDVRTPAEFERVHALGAWPMPLEQMDSPVVASQLNRDEPLYVICQSGGRAAKACQRLEQIKVPNVYLIEGGMTAWEQAGLPVERGSRRVISLERQVRIVAGSLVLLGIALAWTVHRDFLAIPTLVGAGLVFAGVTDFCGMAKVLGKMPWNRT